MTIRQLIPGQDDQMYFDARQVYLHTTDHMKTGYTPLSRIGFISNHGEFFNEKLMSDYMVMGDVVDNEVVGLAIGYKNDFVIDRVGKSLLPGWHLAFTWKKAKDWKAPQSDLMDLTHPICLRMEKEGLFSFTKIMRCSEKIIDRIGAARYVNEVHLKNVPSQRYDCHVEKVIRSMADINALPTMWRRLMPDQVVAPLLFVSHQLKNEYREAYL
jgi:hypothetical protein